MSAPIPVTVRRYQCPHCSRTHGKRPAAIAHMGRCWKNPDNQTCRTCAHLEEVPSGEPCYPGRYCNCNEGWTRCLAGVDLPAGPEFPLVGCPKWATNREVAA